MNFDDSWYPLMARDAGEAGYIGNAVYMFNVTENPFVASQYAMQVWGAIGGWGLVWQRCLPLLFGLLTWALLRTFFVLLGRRTEVRHACVPWALLLAHLLWWLPFGLTLRPEPLIVLLSVIVLLLVELARDREAPILYAGAVMAAAMAIACSPTGVVADRAAAGGAPAGLAEDRRDDPGGQQLAVLAVLAAASSVAVPVAFADASLGDVIEASAVHAYYYDTVPWYDELVHYQTLLGPGRTPWAARMPILITLGLTLLVAAGSGRRGPDDDALRRVLLHAAATTAVAFALVAASPTKWVLHFPAIAASGTVLIALALLRGPMPRHDRALATTGGVAVLVIATSVSYAGWNLWRPYTDRGQFFGAHADPYPTPLSQNLLAPHFGPIFLRNPLVWVAVAVLAAVWAHWSLRRWPERRLPRPEPDRALLAVACASVVVGLIGVLVLAPLRQYPGWTVALGNVKDVVRQGCGLEDNVTVLRPTPVPLGAPVTPATTTGNFVDDTVAPVPEPVPGLGRVWHDVTDDSSGRGTVVTGWYPVPAGSDATDVVVPMLEDGPPDERVSVEFGDGPAANPRVLGRTGIDYLPNADERTWQQRPASLVDAPGDPAFVRVVVDSTGQRGSGPPRRRRALPRAPVADRAGAGRPARARRPDVRGDVAVREPGGGARRHRPAVGGADPRRRGPDLGVLRAAGQPVPRRRLAVRHRGRHLRPPRDGRPARRGGRQAVGTRRPRRPRPADRPLRRHHDGAHQVRLGARPDPRPRGLRRRRAPGCRRLVQPTPRRRRRGGRGRRRSGRGRRRAPARRASAGRGAGPSFSAPSRALASRWGRNSARLGHTACTSRVKMSAPTGPRRGTAVRSSASVPASPSAALRIRRRSPPHSSSTRCAPSPSAVAVCSVLRYFARPRASMRSCHVASRIRSGVPSPDSMSSRHARMPSCACTRRESRTLSTSRR